MKQPDYLINIPQHTDSRGDLCVVEAQQLTGYDFKRVFYFDSKSGDHQHLERGNHAHKQCHQFFVCLTGSVSIDMEDQYGKHSYNLDNKAIGLLARAKTWVTLKSFSPDAVVMVFASDPYDPDDYIHNYDEFIHNYDEFRAHIDDNISHNNTVEFAPLKRMAQAHKKDFMAACEAVIDSGYYIGGNVVTSFEQSFAQFSGAQYAIGCGNGLDALSLILDGYGIGQGDEVILPANSCIASALAVTSVNATPVLVDCLPTTYGMNVADVKAAITPQTKAIMPVHLYGFPADMDPLIDLAQQYNLKIIQDAAQAHGAIYRHKPIGQIGDAAAFSFYPTKNLGAMGDGGMVVTDDKNLADRIRQLSNYGSSEKNVHTILGRNSRLDPMQAAILNQRLPLVDPENARRRQLATLYLNSFHQIDGLICPQLPDDIKAVWHIFPLLIEKGDRDLCIDYLKTHGIQTLIHYPIPIHQQECYAGHFDDQYSFPVTEYAAQNLISLPLTPWHTDDEIIYVADTIKQFVQETAS